MKIRAAIHSCSIGMAILAPTMHGMKQINGTPQPWFELQTHSFTGCLDTYQFYVDIICNILIDVGAMLIKRCLTLDSIMGHQKLFFEAEIKYNFPTGRIDVNSMKIVERQNIPVISVTR